MGKADEIPERPSPVLGLRGLAVLLAVALLFSGCQRCNAPKSPVSGTASPEAKAAGAKTAEREATPVSPTDSSTPAPPAQAWDVLIEAPLPLLDSDAVDEALRPLAATLRQLPEVSHVWTRARPGSMRALVRFDRAHQAQAADSVHRVWRSSPPPGAGVPTIAAIPRGAHAALAYTLVSDQGRQSATTTIDERVAPVVARLTGVRTVRTAGAIRPYVLLYTTPTALQSYTITADRFFPALRSTLTRETHRTLSRLLSDATLKRGPAPRNQAQPEVALEKLITVSRGVGEPLPEAQVGPNMVTTALAIVGVDSDTETLFRDDAHLIIGGLQRELLREGLHFSGRNLLSAHRFVFRRPTKLGQEARRAFKDRIKALLAEGGIHDLVTIDGLDGIPWELDREGRRGSLRTIWLMTDADASLEEIFDRVSLKLAVAGWRAHLLDERSDTGLLWLLGESATAGAIASARNPQLIAAPIRTLADLSIKTRSTCNVRTGPRLRAPPLPFATLDRASAKQKKVAPATIGEMQRLGQGPIYLGRVDDLKTWLTLPTGRLGDRNGDLPLGPKDASLRWADLLHLPDQTPQTDRLREDGKPALWVLLDSALEASQTFTVGFWQTAERVLEPSPFLVMRSIRLDQTPIQEPQVAP